MRPDPPPARWRGARGCAREPPLGSSRGDASSGRGPQGPGGLERRGGAVDHVLVDRAARQPDRVLDALGPKLPCATTTGCRSPSRIAPPTFSGSSSSRSPPSGRGPAGRRGTTRPRSGSRRGSRPRPPSRVPSITLSATLPVKPSATTTSAPRAGQVGALDVADEVEPPASASARARRARRACPCRTPRRSRAGRPRARDALHGLHEARAHVRELDEVLGAHLDVRARVEQEHGPAGDRHEHGERRAVDALDPLDGSVAAASVGPGAPAETSASARPRRRRRAAWTIEASRFERTAATASSPALTRLGRVDDLGVRAGGAGDLGRGAEQEDGQPRAGDSLGDCARPLVGAVRVDRDHSSSGRARPAARRPRDPRRCRSSGRRGAAAAARRSAGSAAGPAARSCAASGACSSARGTVSAWGRP